MNGELLETLRLIIARYKGRTSGSVFIPMKDFSWYNHRDSQLTKLHEEGMINKPRFFDNGAEIILTEKGQRYFVEVQVSPEVSFPATGLLMSCPICGRQAKVRYTNNPNMQDAINAVVERVRGKETVETVQMQVSDDYEDKISIEGIDIPETLRDG